MKRILLVEDDQTLAKRLALSLQSSEVCVLMIHTLSEANVQLSSASFDLIILDIGLPDGRGWKHY